MREICNSACEELDTQESLDVVVVVVVVVVAGLNFDLAFLVLGYLCIFTSTEGRRPCPPPVPWCFLPGLQKQPRFGWHCDV